MLNYTASVKSFGGLDIFLHPANERAAVFVVFWHQIFATNDFAGVEK